jgi:predicted small lipoprotein YifL
MKISLLSVVALLSALALTGCGRAGSPSPPGPAGQITYPHGYPVD